MHSGMLSVVCVASVCRNAAFSMTELHLVFPCNEKRILSFYTNLIDVCLTKIISYFKSLSYSMLLLGI